MRRWIRWLSGALIAISVIGQPAANPGRAERPTLYWANEGPSVRLLQWKLQQWDYYRGDIDGVLGPETYRAVLLFQRRNGLAVDGVVGPETWAALGLGWTAAPPARAGRSVSRDDDLDLLAHAVHAEAGAEPYEGQVAVAAVILNRVQSPSFPNTIAGVIYEPGAFESVDNGWIYSTPTDASYRAARDALNGWDPTYGCLFFWAPAKVSPTSWVWTRQIVTRIGNHVFAR